MKKYSVLTFLVVVVSVMGVLSAGVAADIMNGFISGKKFLTNETIRFANGIRVTIQAQHKIDTSILIAGIHDDGTETIESIWSTIDRNRRKHFLEEEMVVHLDTDEPTDNIRHNDATSACPIKASVSTAYNFSFSSAWMSPMVKCEAATLYIDMIAGSCILQEWTGSRWSTFGSATAGRLTDRCNYMDRTYRQRGYRGMPVGVLNRADIAVIYYRLIEAQ